MSSTDSSMQPQRSEFVTVLAWIFIGLGGLSTLMAVAQYLMFNFMMSVGHMQDAMNAETARGDLPPAAAFMVGHFRHLIGAFFLLSLITLVAALGLLKRRNWARLVFIGLMALGIVWNLAGLVLQRVIMSSMLSTMPLLPPDAPPDFHAQFATMMMGMQIVAAIFALGFSVLFGWIIKRLMSAGIRREFGAAP